MVVLFWWFLKVKGYIDKEVLFDDVKGLVFFSGYFGKVVLCVDNYIFWFEC